MDLVRERFFDRWLTPAIAMARWQFLKKTARCYLLPATRTTEVRGGCSRWLSRAWFMLGEQAQAGQLYPLVRELIDTGAVVGWPIPRYTQTIAGLAAAAAHQWEAAEKHFQLARRQADVFPDRPEQAEICRFHAMMLLDRARPRRPRKGANISQ